jgi:2-oxoglutarate dehydrogenase E1 component
VGRGTFSHRHAVIHSQKDGSAYIPLQSMKPNQPVFDLYDSYLSEEAVLAFEYGYATTAPGGLVIWEAQFGDFANGAQVVIDQFITSGEHKWGRLCGLTMLLPHGYEGQGPEHSSARLERFMQLCAEHNIQVCVPTTPAQIFHMLRRQAIRPMRRPLVVMSPKSLLRHKLATSTLEDLANGQFQNVIDDQGVDAAKVKRVVLCSGKVYYTLLEERMERKQTDVAFIRLEQLYPFPDDELANIVKRYKNAESIIWCQEEPMNQGAWYSSQHHLRRVANEFFPGLYLEYVGREASAAPAGGYMSAHIEEQNRFVNLALSV